ncbi:MAG: RHS repeat-associated core domain-containing protein, partial [Kiloniellales bacterium]|nr:RHS repeat-associated core domain-containing protein [Kiloniellales bacterium]
LSGTAVNDNRFPGQLADAVAGFHYNYFRDYDPTTGRYMQSDPIGLEGGLNTYGYVVGNLINAVDPKGLEGLVLGDEVSDEPFETTAYGECLKQCVVQHYGMSELISRGAVAAGATPVYKPAIGLPVLSGASRYTNPISLIGHVTSTNPKLGTKVLGTGRVFGILGRANIVLGAGLLTYDTVAITDCVLECLEEGCNP